MKSIPAEMRPYKQTAVFTHDAIPAGLKKSHTTKPGAWAKIVVLSGELKYRILTDPPEEHLLSPSLPGVVEETVPHEIEPVGPASFYLEFYKRSETPEASLAREMDRDLSTRPAGEPPDR